MTLASSAIERFWFGDEDPYRSAQEAAASFSAAFGRALRLRAFPGAVADALRLLGCQSCEAREVTAALERDAAVSARLLILANSAVFGGRTKCASVAEALVRLGTRQTAEVVLSVAALGMFEDTTGVATLIRDHSVAVAAMARSLASRWGKDAPDSVFTAGLFSDLGKLFALAASDIAYDALEARLLEEPDTVHVMERMLVGWDHAVLGAHLIAAWGLPEELAVSVAWHHQPGRAYDEGGSVALSVAFIRLADALEYGLRKNPDPTPERIGELARSGAASYLGLGAAELSALWPRLVAIRTDALRSLCRCGRRAA